eukprot:4099105-Pleurochrysis_carterae.AAC.1
MSRLCSPVNSRCLDGFPPSLAIRVHVSAPFVVHVAGTSSIRSTPPLLTLIPSPRRGLHANTRT